MTYFIAKDGNGNVLAFTGDEREGHRFCISTNPDDAIMFNSESAAKNYIAARVESNEATGDHRQFDAGTFTIHLVTKEERHEGDAA